MKKIVSSITALLFVSALFAQQKPAPTKLDRSIRPQPAPAPAIKLGTIQSFELANGLKVFLVENHKNPTVAYSIALNIHPEMEGDIAGTANATGELLTSGTKNRTKDQFDNDIDFIGATLSASANGIYGSALKKKNEKLLELMSDVLLNPNFKQEELDKIKTQSLSGLAQQKDDPDAISKNVKDVLNFGKKHPYGELTTEETVAKISLEKCNHYYNTYFRPNVAYLAIVGDVRLAEIKPLIEKYFGGWQRGEVPQPKFEMPQAPAKTRVAVVNKAGAVQSVINVTYPVDLAPNSPDVIKAKVLNTILGAGFSSRLFMNLREKHGYTYGSYSSLSNDELVSEFSAYAKVRNAVTDSSITEILYELNRIRTEKVSTEELEGIKSFITGSFAISLEDAETVARFAINIERYKLPKDYYENYLKNLSAVTADDIMAMAQKYIRPDNATILIVGDKDELVKKVSKFSASHVVELYDNYGNTVLPTSIKNIPAGVTSKTVIDAYVNAVGGEKALNAIKDIKITMKTELQGRSLTVETQRKAPNKYTMSFSMGPMTLQKQVCDGTKAKESGMQGKKEITGKDLEELKEEATMNVELQYEKLGYKLNLKGIEDVKGSDAFIMEITAPSGKKSTEWFDVKTGFKVKSSSTTTTEQGTMTQVSEYADYKDYSGTKYPTSISITGTPMPLKLQMESVEVNKGIKDGEFEVN